MRYTVYIFTPLSLTGTKWTFPQKMLQGSVVEHLAKMRNIDIKEGASWETLEDPFALGDMKKVVERIRTAIQNQESVCIIGDYDADGITAAAQLSRFFLRNGIDPYVILPHRQKHGYGIHSSFISKAHKAGVTLLITVDNGIRATAEVQEARSKGIDVIITDHHTPPTNLPDALIIHPENHNNPFLSGSGVVFTLLRALENDWGEKDIDVALAAIGTIADVMPLTGENRTIVQLGLHALNTGRGAPIFDLANMVRKNGELLTSMHIGFRIAPRINAAGRISEPSIALTALLRGGKSLEELSLLNEKRQEETLRMWEQAEEEVCTENALLSVCSSDFHPGIIGLIAGKLMQAHGKPSIVGCHHNDNIVCSLRSISSYDITKALGRLEDYLVSFGGHAAAAGCTVDPKKWDTFISAFQKDAEDHLQNHDLARTLHIDVQLDAPTIEHVRGMQMLEPFGEGNPEPRVLLKRKHVSDIRCVGKNEEHLQCSISGIKAVGFGLGHLHASLPKCIDLVCRLGIDSWNGREEMQLLIEDIRCAQDQCPVQEASLEKVT